MKGTNGRAVRGRRAQGWQADWCRLAAVLIRRHKGQLDAAEVLAPARMAALAEEMEAALLEHVRHAWFPRCIDHERGGYLSDFDRRWQPNGPQQRMLEFQARQTRAAARLALMYPTDGDLAEHALHGFRYLRDVMWDHAGGGGWFWLLEADGRPIAAETKHAHSGSYAVQAGAVVFAATGEQSAFEMALEGFNWFERHAWDPEHGGYYGWFRRDGSVIRNAAELPPGLPSEDPLQHEVGLKDINVQGDWFEALLDLLPHTGAPEVRARLESLAALYLDPLTTADGRSVFTFSPAWEPQPGPEHFGYGFQGAHRLLDGEAVLPSMGLAERGEAMAVHAFRMARRKGGGYALSDGTDRRGPMDVSRFDPRRRAWWIQFEALRTAAQLATRPGRRQAAFGRVLERQWSYVVRVMLDRKFGGVFGTDPADLMPWERPFVRPNGQYLSKSSLWKDASHQADALIAAIRDLRAAAANT